jgi:hypothetical protein
VIDAPPPGFLNLRVVDADAHAPLFPLERAAWVVACALERALREGLVEEGAHAGLFRLQSHWAIRRDGLYMTMVIVANRRGDVLCGIVPKTWGRFHLGAIPWHRFPAGVADAAQQRLAEVQGPLIARGGLVLASAHQELAWRAWCEQNREADRGAAGAAQVAP